ncbi:MAG TPA: hypothetical protein VJS44_01965 [Pyrinomonadaceae bacterium]|nr:hypothetical protein [Pyrinomonadaceae bacterium]
MQNKKLNLALGLSLLLAVALACNFSMSTANISSLKVGKDEKATTDTATFGPKDKVYIVATLSNTSDKWKMKCTLFFDDVQGQKSGDKIPDSEKIIELPGAGTATFWYTWGGQGWPNGKYKAEVSMVNEQGEEKDKKSVTFDVKGGTSGTGSGSSSNSSDDMSNMNMSNSNEH